MPAPPYYRWLREPVGPAGRLRGERIAALRQAHEDDAEFGYRLLADEARQVGFPMADRTAWRLCQQSGIMSAIVKTRKKRGNKPGPPKHGTAIHSDQGTVFTSRVFTQRAKDAGFLPSMGAVGSCFDNSMIESFWGRVHTALLNRGSFAASPRISQRDVRVP